MRNKYQGSEITSRFRKLVGYSAISRGGRFQSSRSTTRIDQILGGHDIVVKEIAKPLHEARMPPSGGDLASRSIALVCTRYARRFCTVLGVRIANTDCVPKRLANYGPGVSANYYCHSCTSLSEHLLRIMSPSLTPPSSIPTATRRTRTSQTLTRNATETHISFATFAYDTGVQPFFFVEVLCAQRSTWNEPGVGANGSALRHRSRGERTRDTTFLAFSVA